MSMYCGIVLSGTTDEDCGLAFLDGEGEVETFSVAEDDDIVDLLEEHRPDVVALNAAPDRDPSTEFRHEEQELVDSGYAMLPQGMRDRAVLERAAHLATVIESSGIGARVIESDPDVIAQALEVAGDEDLVDRDIEPDDIEHVREFDAVLLAVVARMEADGETEAHGLVVPEGATETEPDERDADEPEVQRDERSL